MGPGQEYSEFFKKFHDAGLGSIMTLFILGLCRLAPIVTMAPFLAAKLPSPIKAGILVSFTIIFLPHLATTCTVLPEFDIVFIGYMIKEIFLGFLLGFLVCIPFYFAQTAGVLIDFLRGASSLQVSDPFSQAQTSPIGNLYNYVLIAMFYSIGGIFFFFDSILSSYSLIPPDKFINPLFFNLQLPFWQTIMALTTKVVALSIQLSAPSLLSILMTEVFLGVANRLAPQVQISFLGMSLKSLLGLTLLCAGWFFILEQLQKQTLLWLKEIDRILTLIPPS